MPYAKKKSMSKRKPFAKRKVYRKRRPRVRSNANTTDATVLKINPGKARVQRWMKTSILNIPGFASSAGTNGFSIALGSTTYVASGSMTFDPAGYAGNVSGPINSTVTSFSTLSSLALPEWTSFSNLYAQYKVNKITLKFTTQQTSTNNVYNIPQCSLYMRYNDEYSPGALTPLSISEEKNWIRKTFTAEHPDFTYSFYPKVWYITDNLGLAATDARVTKSMPWTNMNAPAELAGMKFYISVPAVPVTSPSFIYCDIQYDISFKEQT